MWRAAQEMVAAEKEKPSPARKVMWFAMMIPFFVRYPTKTHHTHMSLVSQENSWRMFAGDFSSPSFLQADFYVRQALPQLIGLIAAERAATATQTALLLGSFFPGYVSAQVRPPRRVCIAPPCVTEPNCCHVSCVMTAVPRWQIPSGVLASVFGPKP